MDNSEYKRKISLLILPLFIALPAQVIVSAAISGLSLPDIYKTAIIPQLLYPLLFEVPYIIMIKKYLNITPIKAFKGNAALPGCVSGIFVFMLAAICSSFLNGKLIGLINSNETVIKPLSSSAVAPTNALEYILWIIAIVMLPAILEETVFRGIILPELSEYTGAAAIPLSALLFALMHANFNQIPVAFICGCVSGYYAYTKRGLLLPVLMHGTNNLASVIFTSLQRTLPEEAYSAANNITTAVFCSIGGLCLIIEIINGIRRRRVIQAAAPDRKETSSAIKGFFTAPAFIIYAAVMLAIAVMINLK